jgi:coenzyme F420-reducing hydrogenase alpha subunit
MTHVVVDPVTRIEGHLRIEAEVDGGKVQDAWSSSTMFRGIEPRSAPWRMRSARFRPPTRVCSAT